MFNFEVSTAFWLKMRLVFNFCTGEQFYLKGICLKILGLDSFLVEGKVGFQFLYQGVFSWSKDTVYFMKRVNVQCIFDILKFRARSIWRGDYLVQYPLRDGRYFCDYNNLPLHKKPTCKF